MLILPHTVKIHWGGDDITDMFALISIDNIPNKYHFQYEREILPNGKDSRLVAKINNNREFVITVARDLGSKTDESIETITSYFYEQHSAKLKIVYITGKVIAEFNNAVLRGEDFLFGKVQAETANNIQIGWTTSEV